MAVGTFGGPTASMGAELVGAISEAAQRKNVPEDGLESNKVAVANNGDTYSDFTQLSRLGLRQIPMVGSRLQNTFVPYQSKEDQQAKKDGIEKLSDTERKNFYSLSDSDKEDYKTTTLADKAMKKEKEALKESSDVKTLSDGKIFAKVGEDYKTFDSKADYDKAVKKEEKQKVVDDFLASDSKTKEIDGKMYLKANNEQGYSVKSKTEYDFDKAMQGVEIEIDKAKAANNLEAWNTQAEKKYIALNDLLASYDPETEFDKIDTVKKKILDLQQEYEKYDEKGYIRKGGKGKNGKYAPKYDYKIAGFGGGTNPISFTRTLQELLKSVTS
jgi:hypothetical protein